MISYKNITVLGTSHIAIESVKQVEALIKEKMRENLSGEMNERLEE